jgi:hypothetical protein
MSDVAGSASADTASGDFTNRSVHLVGGNGGFAWFTLLFPHSAIATGSATNAAFAFTQPGKAVKATLTDNTWYYAPESPWQKLGKKFQMTGFMGGKTETHTTTPTTAATPSATSSMLAGAAAIQQANPTLLPVIAINPFVFGTAPGAPPVSQVANAQGLIGLFNSHASQVLLAQPSDASLHEAYYKAFLGLNAAAGRSTMSGGYNTGKVAANLLGKNLSSQLTPTTTDDANYGITAGTPSNVVEIAHAMITALKAFSLGLTSSIIIPSMLDDPHGAFSGGLTTPQQRASQLGQMFNQFMTDASGIPDPTSSSSSLADNLVITIHGDTPKTPLDTAGWGDGTPSNSNWLYVMGNGYLKTGWFGGVNADGSVDGFDPSTGALVPKVANTMATAPNAATAALYAIAKGDSRRVEDFSTAVIDGLINLVVVN